MLKKKEIEYLEGLLPQLTEKSPNKRALEILKLGLSFEEAVTLAGMAKSYAYTGTYNHDAEDFQGALPEELKKEIFGAVKQMLQIDREDKERIRSKRIEQLGQLDFSREALVLATELITNREVVKDKGWRIFDDLYAALLIDEHIKD